MSFTHKYNNVRGFVGRDNDIFVMEERQMFRKIWVFKDWCRASAHRPTEFFNSNLYKRPHTLHPFGKIKFKFNEKNIALFRYYFMECITFKLEDSKQCRHLQKEVFWIFVITTRTLL